MSRIRITLKPLDDGQKPVEIPYGKTTIGRGPFLGCSDKKVSRNHAVLEVTDKWEVFLTPTHVNPCFYQPTGDSPGQILKKDSPHKLEHGDTFSLLPKAFRYQLIVENDQEQNDQKDLKGKTNGSTAKCDAILNERNKDLKKAISNEDLNDANTVTDKSPSKEDPTTNTEKNCSKEESSPAKKSDENNKSQTVSNENSEKEKTTDTNSVSKTEEKPESDKDSVDKKDTKEDSQDEEEKCDEDNEEVEKPKCSEKVVEENESTLGNDAFAKDKTDSVQSTDKPESKEKSDSKKTEISASNGDENLDSETKEDEPEDEKSRDVPEWVSSNDPPPSKRGRKRGSPKKPPAEKKPIKRKTETKTNSEDGVSVKKRGRKKTLKFPFDDGEGPSQSNVTPGRTSSRTNRQSRQGISLEDFIVSDDDEWQSDRDLPKWRRRKGGPRKKQRGDESGSDWEIDHKKIKKPAHKYGSGSESGSDWGSPKKKKVGPGRGRRRKPKPDVSDAGSDEEELEQPSSEPEKKSRISCTYGKKCFRRNQNHKDQFSHPGDSDYEAPESEAPPPAAATKNDAVSESEDESGKKECPFGENCFRKTLQHKKDFKHTKKVRPKRDSSKQAGKKGRGSRNNEEVDSYDLNDSLLNEESDEYKPADSGSDFETSGKTKKVAARGKGAKTKRGRKV